MTKSGTSDLPFTTFKSHFVLEEVLELAQLRKDSHSAYKNLVEKRELTRLACRKAGYFGQRRLQTVQDFEILGAKGLFFFCTLLKVLR